jgi:parallel beta-helix repeat protein
VIKRLRRLLLAALLILIATTAAQASTFHVATAGSDQNPGTSAQPWNTLQHAVDTVQPGDTILVEGGTYTGCRVGNSGRENAVCTVSADSGAAVLVNAPGPGNKHDSNIEFELFGSTVNYWVINGIESAGAGFSGIDIRGTNYITVQNCYVHNSGMTGIFLAFSDHPTIQACESAFNGEHGVYDSNSGDYPTILGNKLHDNQSCGLHMNGDRNFQPGDGIISFAVVEKNTIYQNGAAGGSGINCDGVNDSIFANNLLYNNLASGISLFAIDGAEGSSRNRVYNNTIVMAAGARWCVNIPESTEGQSNPTGNLLENNILYTPDSSKGSVLVYSPSVAGFVSDYNAVVGRFSTDGGNAIISTTAWQGLGYDTHSIVSTPQALFLDAGGNNYHLAAGSPAIGAGINLPAVTDDIDGNSRPLGLAYSIGCYEAIWSSVPPGPRDFFPTTLSVVTGNVKSGNAASLGATDGVYLRVKSAPVDGRSDTLIEYDFLANLATVSSLAVAMISHPSIAPQQQQTSLYNFATAAWDTVDVRKLIVTTDSMTAINVGAPSPYLSASGEVRMQVSTGDLTHARWKLYVDLVQLTMVQ